MCIGAGIGRPGYFFRDVQYRGTVQDSCFLLFFVFFISASENGEHKQGWSDFLVLEILLAGLTTDESIKG